MLCGLLISGLGLTLNTVHTIHGEHPPENSVRYNPYSWVIVPRYPRYLGTGVRSKGLKFIVGKEIEFRVWTHPWHWNHPDSMHGYLDIDLPRYLPT